MGLFKREVMSPQVVQQDGDIVIEREGFLNYKFSSAIKKTKREEYVRMRLNYQVVTILSWFNLGLLFPIALLNWGLSLFGMFDFALLNFMPWWLFILLWLLPYLTWHYSTITIPQKEGPRIVKDWSKTEKGRFRAALFNLVPFHVMCWSAFAKYIFTYYLGYLTGIRLQEPHKNIILTDDLDTFILILFVLPVIFSGLILFVQVRDYMINKDLLENHFMTWESPYFKRYAHEYVLESCDVIVGFEIDTKKPIIIKEDARFLHEAIIGATGSGKTSTTLLLRIAQDLLKIATGVRECGLVFLEPKGDGVDDVLTICKKLGIPDEKIMVIDPTKSWSMKYNPFDGNRESAAASFQGTLSALAGDQDPFFKDQQNEAANMYALLAKIRYGKQTNILHVQKMFSDARYLADVVETVRGIIERSKERSDITTEMRNELESYEHVVSFFENDVLDYKTYREKEDIKPVLFPIGHKYQGRQMVESKKDKYITGGKKYLNDIAQNSLLRALFVSAEGEQPFNADEFLKNGGIVLVNTALGELDELSLMFGQFFIRNFQSAVFRRAKEDKAAGVKRIPIYFYVDEFPLYANEAFERFLTLGRSFKVGAVIAMQSIAQLDAVGLAYRKSVLGNASHKTVFGRGPVEDNEYFSKEFGEHLVVEESFNESGSPMTNDSQTWGYRINTQKKLAPRFTPTDIRELPFKQMVVQVVNERNSIAVPKRAVGQFVHESPFIQRFMTLVESEIKSTNEDGLDYSEHISSEQLSTFSRNITSDFTKYTSENKESYEQVPTLSSSPELSIPELHVLDVTNAHSIITDDVMDTLKTLQQSVQDVQVESNVPEKPSEELQESLESVLPLEQDVSNDDDEWLNMIVGDTANEDESTPVEAFDLLPADEQLDEVINEPLITQWDEFELMNTLLGDEPTDSKQEPLTNDSEPSYEVPEPLNQLDGASKETVMTPQQSEPLIVSNSSEIYVSKTSGQYMLNLDDIPNFEMPTAPTLPINDKVKPTLQENDDVTETTEHTVVEIPEPIVTSKADIPAKKNNVIPLPNISTVDSRYVVKDEVIDDDI